MGPTPQISGPRPEAPSPRPQKLPRLATKIDDCGPQTSETTRLATRFDDLKPQTSKNAAPCNKKRRSEATGFGRSFKHLFWNGFWNPSITTRTPLSAQRYVG